MASCSRRKWTLAPSARPSAVTSTSGACSRLACMQQLCSAEIFQCCCCCSVSHSRLQQPLPQRLALPPLHTPNPLNPTPPHTTFRPRRYGAFDAENEEEEETPEWAMELAQGAAAAPAGPGKLQQPVPVPFDAFEDHSSSSSDSDDEARGPPSAGAHRGPGGLGAGAACRRRARAGVVWCATFGCVSA